MIINRESELRKKNKYHEAWNISKKYTTVLMDHETNDEHFDIAVNIHAQYISELRYKNIDSTKQKIYIQVWNTMLNTILKNPKKNVCRAAMKLLHQTSIQRSF